VVSPFFSPYPGCIDRFTFIRQEYSSMKTTAIPANYLSAVLFMGYMLSRSARDEVTE